MSDRLEEIKKWYNAEPEKLSLDKLREYLNQADEYFTWLISALESAWTEIERLRAQHAAAVCAWEEYAHVPGLQPIAVGKVQYPDGTIKDLALRPDQIMGFLQGIEKRVRECLPFGVEAVRARQDIDGIRADRDRWKARAENAEPFLRELSEWGCMKEECDWVAACPQSKLPIEEWCISCRADAALEDTK